ncbi:MAG: hypothetical protein PHV74_15275 [Dehalococcoidia bacterium]|nr:hypothetical protein [Dehalococcoidia bacterium]
MKKIGFKQIVEAAQKIESLYLDSRRLGYLRSYPIYLDFFRSSALNTNSDFTIRAAIVYSWMPNVLMLKEGAIGPAVTMLKSLTGRMDESGKEEATARVAAALNGSFIGASKFLHFQYPNSFPIYDTNIYKHLNGIKDKKKPVYSEANKSSCYRSYRISVGELIARADFEKDVLRPVNGYFNSHFNYEVTPQRAVEFLIFELYGD